MDSTSNDIAKEVTSSENDIYVTGYSEMLQYAHQSGSSAVSTLSYIGKDDDENNPGLNTPGKFSLYQNYPNPFNPSTTIKFDIPEKSNVKLQVYDILGKVVDIMIDQVLEAGSYSYTYANKNLSSGVYFYQLTAGDFSEVKKMSLIK
jgi:hypothetical protein